MPTLIATPGAANANSYATLAEATTYFDERVGGDAWGLGEAEDQERALIMATRRLDTLTFVGFTVTDLQALKWPRRGAFDESGWQYDPATIPAPVKHATFEAALVLLGASGDPFADSPLAQFDRAKVGSLEVDINHGHSPSKVPDAVMRILRHVLRSHRLMAQLERS